jgi:hypothetical protein
MDNAASGAKDTPRRAALANVILVAQFDLPAGVVVG